MPRDPRAWLTDILTACELLFAFTRGKTFADYAGDALLRSAVERQFQIVGEALRVTLAAQPRGSRQHHGCARDHRLPQSADARVQRRRPRDGLGTSGAEVPNSRPK